MSDPSINQEEKSYILGLVDETELKSVTNLHKLATSLHPKAFSSMKDEDIECAKEKLEDIIAARNMERSPIISQWAAFVNKMPPFKNMDYESSYNNCVILW